MCSHAQGPEFLPGGERKKRTKSSRTSRSVGLPPLPHPLQRAAPMMMGAATNTPAAAKSVRKRSLLRENGTFFEFSLCLSRACLGKMMHFIYKWLKKCRFLTFRNAFE
jgi:hypothetical protein